MQLDLGFEFDDAHGQLDQAQPQGVELDGAPGRAARHQRAQAPHQPVGGPVQEQAKLVGGGLGARCAVGGEVALPAFDVVFRLAPLAIPPLVEGAGRAARQAGDDEARVCPVRPGLDAGDNAFDPVPYVDGPLLARCFAVF